MTHLKKPPSLMLQPAHRHTNGYKSREANATLLRVTGQLGLSEHCDLPQDAWCPRQGPWLNPKQLEVAGSAELILGVSGVYSPKLGTRPGFCCLLQVYFGSSCRALGL